MASPHFSPPAGRSTRQARFEGWERTEKMRVTISCGVASYPVNTQPGRDWQGIVEQADRALYEAKARGRNPGCSRLPGLRRRSRIPARENSSEEF